MKESIFTQSSFPQERPISEDLICDWLTRAKKKLSPFKVWALDFLSKNRQEKQCPSFSGLI